MAEVAVTEPLLFVMVKSASPVFVETGTSTTTVVSVFETTIAGNPPTVTPVTPARPVPVMVTSVPPATETIGFGMFTTVGLPPGSATGVGATAPEAKTALVLDAVICP